MPARGDETRGLSELHEASLARAPLPVQRLRSWIILGVLVAVTVIVWRFGWSPSPAPTVYADLANPVIAIVGATGTGKSSFIDILGGVDGSGKRPVIGHELQSCMFTRIRPRSFTTNESAK